MAVPGSRTGGRAAGFAARSNAAPTIPSRQAGFTLLEVLVAVVLMGAGVLALVRLQHATLIRASGTLDRGQALMIAGNVLETRRAAPALAADALEAWASSEAASRLPEGRLQVEAGGGGISVRVEWFAPGHGAGSGEAREALAIGGRP